MAAHGTVTVYAYHDIPNYTNQLWVSDSTGVVCYATLEKRAIPRGMGGLNATSIQWPRSASTMTEGSRGRRLFYAEQPKAGRVWTIVAVASR